MAVQFLVLIIQFVTGMEIIVLVFRKLSSSFPQGLVICRIWWNTPCLTRTGVFSVLRCPRVCCVSGVGVERILSVSELCDSWEFIYPATA